VFTNLCRRIFHLTSLTIHTTLAEKGPVKTGSHSAAASFEMSWTVLNLQRTPPHDRCCYICNPTVALSYASSDMTHDSVLLQPTFCNQLFQLLLLGRRHQYQQEPTTLSCQHLQWSRAQPRSCLLKRRSSANHLWLSDISYGRNMDHHLSSRHKCSYHPNNLTHSSSTA